MKKKLLVLLSIMVIVALGGSIALAFSNKGGKEEDKLTIVTSFYPMYLLAENITDGLNVEVINLADFNTGCLHDYQLSTYDMKKLEAADVFIMNGGGMESFAGDIIKAYPNLKVITASEGIEYLQSKAHEHESGEVPGTNDINEEVNGESKEQVNNETRDEANGEAKDEINDKKNDEVKDETNNNTLEADLTNNAHVWLNMNNYLKQIQTVQDGLAKFDKENALIYQENGNAYQAKVKKLKNKLEAEFKGVDTKEVVIFHDSFAYLADELGLKVAHTVNLDGDYSLSAGEIAEIIDEVNSKHIKVLFTEEQYSSTIADSIAKETNAKVYVINSGVTGKLDKDAYLNAMENNIEVLKQALK